MRGLSRLHDPAHTGPNRCLPCTAVNGVLLVVVTALVAVASAPWLAVAVLVTGAVLVWQRGYLVPYTPRFAPGIVETLPLPDDWFRNPPQQGSLSDDESVDGGDVLAALDVAGVVRLEGEDVVLEDAFERRWHEEMAALADRSPAALAEAAASIPSVESVEHVRSGGNRWFVVDGRHDLIPRPIVVAELAAVRTLPDDVEPEAVRLAASRVLRQFLEACPVCETELVPSSTTGCCGSPRDAQETRVCPECEQRVLTIPEPDSASEA
ncbi:hypothetical protein SAMN05216559_3108 [Halomicrobium zhouii]|uniref:Uncharacterized protein n=1 Tax=Halomicrobium zhouii TaxID=767519 RepID=A0A1I6LU38_9EURY|nr:hypothetical protein [Halomicrobium zhouii]SFS06840.1 hypothetical protein SAMN05216559_3108 [Halomicrobium zhouii]